jgi:hypothetical protein
LIATVSAVVSAAPAPGPSQLTPIAIRSPAATGVITAYFTTEVSAAAIARWKSERSPLR